ncbi:acylneuraminate cytidylyltransferase family protein [Bradyrhizobium jicamae]|uniref:acylneuraminate cytidylyltransferase family protein n=1 Tax=Bradyrhizobium jicamae TaxID=280332 RepID=UPI001BAC668F|nr:acylneuraminate cytidylyltransferase family protein [Bradyrhizobium jicamae]MBR0757018.1 acylneuraminate cytidylyltransferase family protein [Bradyrhizobium jicamae]
MTTQEAKRTLAVIAARGGSKGIPNKNLIDICGKPLLAWTVIQAKAARGVDAVAVSSDSDTILAAAEAAGAIGVRRPEDISGDLASSESAWLHALEAVDRPHGPFERIVALQATSPIRESSDIEKALDTFEREQLDSLLSVCEVEDYFNWRIGTSGPEPINYDFHNRRMRQQIEKRYLENGSFYVFIPSLLREQQNRLGGKIGMQLMDRHKMFQIDRIEDIKLCAAIMRSYGYA